MRSLLNSLTSFHQITGAYRSRGVSFCSQRVTLSKKIQTSPHTKQHFHDDSIISQEYYHKRYGQAVGSVLKVALNKDRGTQVLVKALNLSPFEIKRFRLSLKV